MTERFKELDNDYLNTGGHCMVDVTAVYDKQQKRNLYMYVGLDWMTLATYDYLREEIDNELEAEDYVLYSLEMSDFTTEPMPDNFSMNNMPDDYFQLFNHGMLSYIKNKFKYDHQLTNTTVENLPLELYRMVSQDYANWLCDNDMLVTTDGDQIIIDDRYKVSELDSNGKAAEEFKQLLEKMREDAYIDDDHLSVFEDEQIHLIIKGKVFTLGMCAAVWNGLVDYADYIISEQ